MKKLKCADFGTTCQFEATGETADEVKMKLMEHGMSAHPDMMENMSEEKKKNMEKMTDEKIIDC